MCDTQNNSPRNYNADGKLFSFKLDSSLAARIDTYIEKPGAKVRFKGQLINLAIQGFLDREEVISTELDKVRSKIEKILDITDG